MNFRSTRDHQNQPSPYAAGDQSGHNCTDCGWPIRSSALKAGKSETGERLYRHILCPSLKQRAALRAEALQPTH